MLESYSRSSHALKLATECPLGLGGSSTLLLGKLDTATSQLHLLNLGDSGAMVLRPHTTKPLKGPGHLWPRLGAASLERAKQRPPAPAALAPPALI